MPRLYQFFLLVSAVLALAGCGPHCTTTLLAPAPLHDQTLGDPCLDVSECATGLVCAAAFNLGPTSRVQNACTVACDAAACPTGSTCVDSQAPRDGGPARICLPSCGADSDCQKTTRAGTCANSVCKPIGCTASACPSGYTCSENGSDCEGAKASTGYCRKNGV